MERGGREKGREEGGRKKEGRAECPTDMSYTTVSTSLSIASLTSFPSAHFNFSLIAPAEVKRDNIIPVQPVFKLAGGLQAVNCLPELQWLSW